MKLHSGLLTTILLGFLGAGCAAPAPKDPAEPAPTAAEAARQAAIDKVRAGSIHVECSVYFVGGASDGANSCHRIDFALETSDGEEVDRGNPDANGSLDFPVPEGKGYRIVPKVPSRWTIEMIPSTELHRGDSVRAILRR